MAKNDMEMYNPDKLIWNHLDFEKMSWHDCPIYGIHFADDVAIDIDYIFKWVLNDQGNQYKFWISPATLIFEKAHDLKIDIDLPFVNGFDIAEIHQEKIDESLYKYHIETHQDGYIELISSGYKQLIRKKPIPKESQCLTGKERDGYSFKIE